MFRTWEALSHAFSEEYYPQWRTGEPNFVGFYQKEGELFYKTLDRFNGLLLNFPHHVYKKEQLTETLYKGLNGQWSYTSTD
ncbi:unnamed protein product [Linum trigynum]|uniref:Retrotransposon gag domain-containing protein n=1 Tax=Linum trigynum TaxID=586398 RepID=A0AAV2DWF5_9ROSI